MRITGTGPINTPSSIKKKRNAAGGDFSGLLSDAEGTEESTATSQAFSLSGIDSLLSLQEVPSEDPLASEAKSRGLQLLDYLDEIRDGLLLGSLPSSRLQELAELSKQTRNRTSDPRLNEILDEIEIRAAVELAKLGK